jgi:hypothetical protein
LISDKLFLSTILDLKLLKPPLIPDLIRFIVEGITPTKLTDVEWLKYELARLTLIRSIEELDNTLLEVLTTDLNEVSYYLPNEYVEYLKVLFESLELNLVYAILRGSKGTSEQSLRFTKLEHYDECGGVSGFSCIISKHLSRLKDACEKVGEDCEPAVAVASLYDILLYLKYLDNLRTLKLKGDILINDLIVEGIKFFKGIGNPYFEVGLISLLTISKKYGGGSMGRFIEEVSTLYRISRDALYYRGGLLNLITLYGIDRLLRYELLRILFSRWLRPW